MIKASQLKVDFSADLAGDNSLKTGVEAGGSKTKALEVVDDELSCFTYTPDLAKATKELVMADKGYGIYHLTNRGACTWYQSAVELFRLTNANTVVVPISGVKLARPAKRPKCSVLLNTKLPQLRDYREALKEYLISQKLN